MGSKSDTFENQFLQLIFLNTGIAGIGDTTGLRGSTVVGNLYVRLHTSASVVDDYNLGTECAYTGYVQYGIPIPRNSTYWNVSQNNCNNKIPFTFGMCTAGNEIIRYFSIWRTNINNTESQRIFWGQLSEDYPVSPNIQPQFGIGGIYVNEE
jgi:hypothetical protein